MGMENTSKVLFSDDTIPQWFVAVGDTFLGPLTAADTYEKILNRELTWAHFIWRPSQKDWRRICETPSFQAAVPSPPSALLQSRVKDVSSAPVIKSATPGRGGPAPKIEERIWFLHYNDAQFGPFSVEEVQRFLRIGKIHGRVYAWKDGMPTWERLERIELYAEAVQEAKRLKPQPGAGAPQGAAQPAQETVTSAAAPAVAEPPAKADMRRTPRRPLVARVLIANEKSGALGLAVCRDVSVGGMQVLIDQVPGDVGAHVRLNINQSEGIRPFVAEGVIVRILEDGRGFSFRFEKLGKDARAAIEDYIASAQ